MKRSDREIQSGGKSARRGLPAGHVASGLIAMVATASAGAFETQVYYELAYTRGTNSNSDLVVTTNVPTFQTVTGPTYYFDQNGYNSVPNTSLTGTATVGALGSLGSSKVFASGSGNGYSLFGQGSWDDHVTFTGAPAGTLGVFSFQMSWDWDASVSARANGFASARPYVDFLMYTGPKPTSANEHYGYVGQTYTQSCNALMQCVSNDTGPQTLDDRVTTTFAGNVATFQTTLVFGETYTLMASLGAFLYGYSSSATVDATHSLHWMGISSVVDTNGKPIDYSVTSESGFNYASPALAVPEAGTAFYLAAGLPVLGWAARKRRGSAAKRA